MVGAAARAQPARRGRPPGLSATFPKGHLALLVPGGDAACATMLPMPRPDPMNEAYDRLFEELPRSMHPFLRWLHSPRSRLVRVPLGILCIVASFFWFMPVVGLEFFPIGLLLLAHDVPFLRRPAGRLTLWLLDRFDQLRDAWRRWRGRSRDGRSRKEDGPRGDE